MPTLKVSPDVELYYQEYGRGDSVVLSAHMAITPGESYQQRLGQAGFHVYSLQLRGFGESTHVFEVPAAGWYATWAEDVYQFGRALGVNQFIYTGVSHGAGVGWHLALAHPEALHAFVAVVGGPHDRTQPRTRGIGVDGGPRLASPEERAISPGKLFPELETNEQVSELLSQVKVPTLLLYAAQDDIIPPAMALLALQAVPGAKLVLYQDHSHSLAHEAPERLVDEFVLFMKETLPEA
jgi:pimeloyl-ACP methyl ester carboxylesterase